MTIKSDTNRDIVKMYHGVDKEICTQYYGRDHLVYTKSTEPVSWASVDIARSNASSIIGSYTGSGADRRYIWTWAQWNSAQLGYPTSTIIPAAWIRPSANPATDQRLWRIIINRETSLSYRRQITGVPDGYIRFRIGFVSHATQRQYQLTSEIEQTNWKLKYKIRTGYDHATQMQIFEEGELSFQGPYSGSGMQSLAAEWTLSSGYNFWIPQASVQVELTRVITTFVQYNVSGTYLRWEIQGASAGDPPTIANFQARQLPRGTLGQDITVNEADFPLQVQFSANITGADRWDFYQAGNTVPLASGLANVDLLHTVMLTDDFKPGSSGWSYNLVAKKTALGACGTRAQTVSVRSVRAPLINTFRASSPASSQGPFQHIVCSNLTGDVDVGDPPAQWNYSQSGKHITHRPKHLSLIHI